MGVINEKNKKKWTKDGRHWYFRCSYRDMQGNTKRYKSRMYISQAEAEEAQCKFLINKMERSSTITNLTFETIFNEWLYYKKRKVKSSTYYDQKTIATKYILNEFKNIKLTSLKENNISLWLEKLEKTNFTIKYKNKIIRFFKEILLYARDNYNYYEKGINILQPIKDESPVVEKKVENYWTHEEFNTFISVVEDEYYYLLFTFLYFTGCRIGETIALNWNDVDFEKKTIKITKTLNSKTGKGTYLITSPKTKNSIREIELTDNLFELLKKHYENEKKIFNFSQDMFIFGNIKHLSETTIRRKLKFYLSKINDKKFKNITLHGFRHSHVSLLVHLGCDFRDIAERVGDTIQMVQNTYYHMYPQDKSKTVTLLNNLK